MVRIKTRKGQFMADIEKLIKKLEEYSQSLSEAALEREKEFNEIIKSKQYRFFAVNLASDQPKIQNEDKEVEKVIITVGVNYGQDDGENENIIVCGDTSIKNMRHNLNKVLGFKDFHLIMTNLSPWITKEKWSEIEKMISFHKKIDFLNQAKNLGYIARLRDAIGSNVTWVGHTKDIWSELYFFMKNELGLKNFYLMHNLSYCWRGKVDAERITGEKMEEFYVSVKN